MEYCKTFKFLIGLGFFIGASLTQEVNVLPYEETSLISFEDVGSLKSIATEWRFTIVVDAYELVSLAQAIDLKADELKRNFTCATKAISNCLNEIGTIQASVRDKAEIIGHFFPSNDRRHRRGINCIGWVLKKITGSMDSKDRSRIKKQFKQTIAKQNEIIGQVADSKQLLVEAFEKLELAVGITNNISAVTQAEFEKIWTEQKHHEFESAAIRALAFNANRFLDMANGFLHLLTTKKISGIVVSLDKLDSIYSRMKATTQTNEEFPFNSIAEICLQRQATLIFNKHLILASIDAPATTHKRWRLYKLHLNPVITTNIINMFSTSTKFLAVSEASELCQLQSVENCYSAPDHSWVCKLLQPITRINGKGCIERAFREQFVDQIACNENIHQAKLEHTTAVRVDENSVIFFTREPLKIKAQCAETRTTEVKIEASSMITSKSPCTISADGVEMMIIESVEREEKTHLQTDFTVNTDFQESKQLPVFPHFAEEELSDIKQLGDRIKQLNDNHIKKNSLRIAEDAEDLWDNMKIISSVVLSSIIFIVICICICRCCVK